MKYSCHICGDIGHKNIDCPKYNDMQNMFKNKGVKIIEKQIVVKPKVANPLVHIVDVNMANTRTKITEEQVFKDKEPKRKSLLLTIEKQIVVKPKVANPSVHIWDVNMANSRTKVTEEQVFKDKEPKRKSLLLTRKRSKDCNNLLSRQYKRCKQKTHKKV
jgi:hypothetical protein